MSPRPSNILSDATNTVRNGIRRVANSQRSARGKENSPPLQSPTIAPYSPDPHRWDPVAGMIILKVSVPCTDDLWRFKVSQHITYRAFRDKVERKVGFAIAFADGPTSLARRVSEEGAFRRWVAGRVKNGRNHPLTALQRDPHEMEYPSTPVSMFSPTFPSSPQTPFASSPPPPPYQDHLGQPLTLF
ncbi:hypothetical protein BDW22DRAFT_1357660 [Trametopsis cervina]|nr:hypothetical protein BDW22DRAFT_1357660 [Trametopsis cervina]